MQSTAAPFPTGRARRAILASMTGRRVVWRMLTTGCDVLRVSRAANSPFGMEVIYEASSTLADHHTARLGRARGSGRAHGARKLHHGRREPDRSPLQGRRSDKLHQGLQRFLQIAV